MSPGHHKSEAGEMTHRVTMSSCPVTETGYENIHIFMMAENKKKIGSTMGGVSYLNFARLSAGVLILEKTRF